MNYIEEITRLHPIRRTSAQKQAFRDWAVAEIQRMGYSVKVEQTGKPTHHNIVIGDPEKAPMLFTAHYDTAATGLLPNVLLPKNPLLWLLYAAAQMLLWLLLAAVVALVVGALLPTSQLAKVLWIAIYVGLILLLTYGGKPNRHNANDNTSGLAAVFIMLAQLPENDREKAAFILFDNEEKGMGGSKAYVKEHLQVGYTRLAVDLHCIGVGENLLVISRKLARQHREFSYLQRHLESIATQKVSFFDSLGTAAAADWKSFKCGVGLCACKRSKLLGFYTPHLHTSRDTQADEGNITAIATALTACIEELPL